MNRIRKYLTNLPIEIDLNSFGLTNIFVAILMYTYAQLIGDKTISDLSEIKKGICGILLGISMGTAVAVYKFIRLEDASLWNNFPSLHKTFRITRGATKLLFLCILISSFQKGLIQMKILQSLCLVCIAGCFLIGRLSGYQVQAGVKEEQK